MEADEFPVMTWPGGDHPLVVRAEVARQLKRELNEARSLLQSCLSAMPCNSTPRHTVESLPDRIEDLAKELASETMEREQLERELAAAHERIRRLEEALVYMLEHHANLVPSALKKAHDALAHKAKETQP
jgi:predicted RNase H-like nuclease (RuvC/YqgF family)